MLELGDFATSMWAGRQLINQIDRRRLPCQSYQIVGEKFVYSSDGCSCTLIGDKLFLLPRSRLGIGAALGGELLLVRLNRAIDILA